LERAAADEARLITERESMDRQFAELTSAIERAEIEKSTTEAAATELQSKAEMNLRQAAELENRLRDVQAACMQQQIVAAKCEQRVAMLRHLAEQAERNRLERARALAERRQRLGVLQKQLTDGEAAALLGRQALADLFLQKERHVEEAARIASGYEAICRQRELLKDQLAAQRHQLASLQSQQHKLEVAISRLRHERQTLCERMQDDYKIDLAEAAQRCHRSSSHSGAEQPHNDLDDKVSQTAFDRGAAEREITQLRDQMNSIGAVNLDALEELELLETRFDTLSQQYRDLVEAKSSLERIIHRINADSRQLFLATVETIRGHFQELFRRLFGGGEADIIMDETDDVLECGIEIVARPPGKEACIISLLSGGEKTLTCVALLLAVFRSKPSPFCVLDEVDAALDEANIGRFVGVLREFLSFTQFVVVTHSKKTMAGADTLYGVTMEESGVSKRVSVRFEDVSEDGQILLSARTASRQHGSSGAVAADDIEQRRAA
jgi:chromosome segregation protein